MIEPIIVNERFEYLIKELLDGATAMAWFKGLDHKYGKECKQMGHDRFHEAKEELRKMVNEQR